MSEVVVLHTGNWGVLVMSQMLSVLKHLKMVDLVGLAGRLAGLAMFIGLIYTYCHALVETCFRGLH